MDTDPYIHAIIACDRKKCKYTHWIIIAIIIITECKLLAWDVTVVYPIMDSSQGGQISCQGGSSSQNSQVPGPGQNVHFPTTCGGIFRPIWRQGLLFSVRSRSENLGCPVSGDDQDSTFLFQHISVLIQRHNSFCSVRASVTRPDRMMTVRVCSV